MSDVYYQVVEIGLQDDVVSDYWDRGRLVVFVNQCGADDFVKKVTWENCWPTGRLGVREMTINTIKVTS